MNKSVGHTTVILEFNVRGVFQQQTDSISIAIDTSQHQCSVTARILHVDIGFCFQQVFYDLIVMIDSGDV